MNAEDGQGIGPRTHGAQEEPAMTVQVASAQNAATSSVGAIGQFRWWRSRHSVAAAWKRSANSHRTVTTAASNGLAMTSRRIPQVAMVIQQSLRSGRGAPCR